MALVALGVAVVTAAALAWQWRTHPRAFEAAGGWTAGHDSLAAGRTVYVGMSYEAREARGHATLETLSPRVVLNSSNATIRLFVCHVNPDGDVGAIGVEGRRHIDDDCRSLVPARGARVELNAEPKQQVVIEISPRRPGQVLVDGIDITYSHGWQRGLQRVGGRVDIRTVEP